MSTVSSSDTPRPKLDSSVNLFSNFKADFLASVVVFLVALPLCIGIAVAVGVDPARALITGIIGGLIVGWFAGSPLQVSGPAAGLFVIVADLIKKGEEIYPESTDSAIGAQAYSLMVLGTSVFLAGLIQIVAGRLRLGQWFRAVSPAVVKGMLAGIGILILLSQFHVMLDHKAMWHGEKAHGALQYMATIPEAIEKCFSSDTSANHHLAALVGVIALACFVLWPKFAPKILRFLPAALIGILIATVFAVTTRLQVDFLQIPDNVLSEVTIPSAPWVQLLWNPTVLTGAVVIAIIASAETLLCATAVDQMHQGPRTKYDQELTAQGIGNVLCGLVGALPMTGVIVRSSANVSSGAKTRMSAIMHGAWLLLFVVAIPFVLAYIPRSALGALLVFTGFKLVNIKDIKNLWKTSRGEMAIYFATVVMIVCTDLLMGVLVGIALSAFKVSVRSKALVLPSNLRVHLDTSDNDQQARLTLEGAATFMCLPKLAAELGRVPADSELHVDIKQLTYIDHACLELLSGWASQHTNLGGKLVIDWNALHARFASSARSRSNKTASAA
jgi:MFS superfamily sulfate permease-like transporter